MGAVVATPGDAGSREMVSARDWASRDKSWTKLAMAEPGPPLGQPQSLRSRVRLRRRSDLSPLWLAAWGRGRQSGPRASGPVTAGGNFGSRTGAFLGSSSPTARRLPQIVR